MFRIAIIIVLFILLWAQTTNPAYANDLDFTIVDVPADRNAYISSSFMTYHDAKDFGVLACDCWEYKILIKPTSQLYTEMLEVN